MERAVGWFVLIAIGLLAFGFVYYVYNMAERKGWFKTKAPYFTFTDRATGLRVGDPVQLMGFDVGQITRIDAQPPEDFYFNVYVEFEIQSPYYGYLWTEGSRAKVATADFLGKRVLEVTKGIGGYPTYIFHPVRRVTLNEARALAGSDRWLLGEEIVDPRGTNILAKPMQPLNAASMAIATEVGLDYLVVLDSRETRKAMTGVWDDRMGAYVPYTRETKPYWLLSDESPAVTERLERIVGQVEKALPGILALTNQLGGVLSNAASASSNLAELIAGTQPVISNLNIVVANAQPAVSNLAQATAQLDRPGGLGEWLVPTNIQARVEETLSATQSTISSADTNLTVLVEKLGRSLENLAGITSNLNSQVQANTNMLGAISEAVVNADHLVQGLKRHWLLRSAFRDKDKDADRRREPAGEVLRSPKDTRRR